MSFSIFNAGSILSRLPLGRIPKDGQLVHSRSDNSLRVGDGKSTFENLESISGGGSSGGLVAANDQTYGIVYNGQASPTSPAYMPTTLSDYVFHKPWFTQELYTNENYVDLGPYQAIRFLESGLYEARLKISVSRPEETLTSTFVAFFSLFSEPFDATNVWEISTQKTVSEPATAIGDNWLHSAEGDKVIFSAKKDSVMVVKAYSEALVGAGAVNTELSIRQLLGS